MMLATIREYAAERLAGRPEAECSAAATPRPTSHSPRRPPTTPVGPRGKLARPAGTGSRQPPGGARLGRREGQRRLCAALRRWPSGASGRSAATRRRRVSESSASWRYRMWSEAPGTPLARRARRAIAYWREDGSAAHALYRDALELARTTDDRSLLAEALTNFGYVPEPNQSAGSGLSVDGRPFFEEAIRLYRELGDQGGLANAMGPLALSRIRAGDLDVLAHWWEGKPGARARGRESVRDWLGAQRNGADRLLRGA